MGPPQAPATARGLASWRRSLRIEPERKAATHALHVLANAGDLPLAARVEYRFLTTSDEPGGRGGTPGSEGGTWKTSPWPPGRSPAWPRTTRSTPAPGLIKEFCLAWLGRNAEAVAALDLAVRAMADAEPVTAVRRLDPWLRFSVRGPAPSRWPTT